MSQPTRDFHEVFRDFRAPIFRCLLGPVKDTAEAEDLTQETFAKVVRALPDFRGESSLSTWLYRIATNTADDHFRSARGRPVEWSLLEEAE